MFRVMMSLRERFYFRYSFIHRSHPKDVAIVHRISQTTGMEYDIFCKISLTPNVVSYILYHMELQSAGTSSNRNAVLEGLRHKIMEAESQVQEAQRRVEALRIAYAEVEALLTGVAVTGNVTDPIRTPTPRSSDAVRIVMAENPRVWNVAELTAELRRRGWMPKGANPDASLRATIHRLGKIGTIEVVERGRYRIVTDSSEPAVEGGEEAI
jgi:hypothetical protein